MSFFDETIDSSLKEGSSKEGSSPSTVGQEKPSGFQETESKSLLNQEEIDHLLAGAKETPSVGIEAILHSGKVSYERLPLLEIVIDRLIRRLSTSLRNFANTTVSVGLEEISSTRFGAYMESLKPPILVGIFAIEEWEDSQSIINADVSLIDCMINVLLGARHLPPSSALSSPEEQARAYTSLEQNLVQRLFQIVLQDFSMAFEPIKVLHFKFNRFERNPLFVTIVRPVNVVVRVKLKIEIEKEGGILEFILPYSSLEPLRSQLLQMFMGEKFGQDAIWEKHFAQELREARIPLQAVLKTVTCPLNEVIRWKRGTHLMLDVKEDHPVHLKCGDLNIGIGQMGQKNNHIAIQIDKSFIKEKKKP